MISSPPPTYTDASLLNAATLSSIKPKASLYGVLYEHTASRRCRCHWGRQDQTAFIQLRPGSKNSEDSSATDYQIRFGSPVGLDGSH